MVAIDGKGRVIPGDKLLIIFAHELGAKRVVTTQEASMTIDEAGFEVSRTRVGDPFVSAALKSGGGFGGEPSGCWFFPKLSLCPDAIYATAWAVKIASETKLSSLADNIPSYPILRGSVPAEKTIMTKVEERLVSSTNPHLVTKIDGIRLAFADGWLLIRPSGTEPIIRVTAEARSQQRANELYGWGIQAIKDCSRE
jgi:phosphoglucosamine mutase